MANKNEQIASEVLAAVGGKDNITGVTHCMTRLRFNLKDISIPEDQTVKAIKGVMGVARSGGQYQVIIGTNVDKVYRHLCETAGIKGEVAITENLDQPKEPLTLKKIGGNIMAYLSGSLTPIIPVVLAAAIFKSLVAVFGPDMLNIMSPEGDLYKLFTFVGDAGYYFFPLLIGYTAAKKLNASPVLGIFLGGIMIHPTFMAMVDEGTPFTVYGIPVSVQNYASTILPILLSVWVMSYIEKFFKKYTPDAIKVLAVPFLTIAIMLPISLCALGPLGSFMGTYICAGILWFGENFGFVGAAIIGGLWEFLVMSGMHHVMIAQMIQMVAANGYDPVVTLGAASASMSVAGMCLGMALALRDKEEKSLGFSYLVAAIIGGVTEPGLYGIGFKYRKPFIGMVAGGAAGGLYAGLLGVKAYVMVPVANFLALTTYTGGSAANVIHGVISGVLAIVVAAVVTYILCREKKAA
ncbi:PTS fructose transporter subunit IIB [bacterium C-53]|nr:PTS fructose transporter subunit IIB [Lachnospiraceae bacterium]NBI03025.1 PTS fructose transporter subunit IIB [Lachnospiraceae bacterium]RKJ10638.1 PTS fructose transporter subunit IIB [bacterium C-53]